LPEHAVVLARREDVGFAEVVQPVDTTCRIVSHDEHSTGAVFLAREQEQMIGAEIEHGQEDGREREAPAPSPAPLRGYPADSSGSGYRTERRMIGTGR